MKFNILFGWIFITLFITFYPFNAEANTSGHLNSSKIISEMNKERASRGMSVLKVDPILSQAAEERSKFLSNAGQIFHVTSPNGTPWPILWNAGYKYTNAGENLALGIETESELSYRWMTSPSHRENILDQTFEDVGVGITYGYYQNRPASYVVVYFGKKRPESVTRVKEIKQISPQITKTPVQSTGEVVTQSTVTASAVKPAPYVLPSKDTQGLKLSKEQEEIRILSKLITYLDSYLKLVRIGSLGLR